MKKLNFLMIYFFIIPLELYSQSLNVSEVGRWAGGMSYAVATDGNYAYRSSGGYFEIIDVQTPASPLRIGQVQTPGLVKGIALSGNYAYVADWDAGLRIIDISNPANPQEVGFYDTPGYAEDVAIGGNYAYVADEGTGVHTGLRVIDISNPANPHEVGNFVTESYGFSLAVSGNYLYVAANYAGLRVLDVSNPANPQEVGFYDTPGLSYDVAVSGNYAYVADYESGLRVIDISIAENPQEVGHYDLPNKTTGVEINVNYAYVTDFHIAAIDRSGLRVIDISNPVSPQELSYYITPDIAQGVAISGDYAYIADGSSGLRVIDVNNPSEPLELGFYETASMSWGVDINDNYAYIANWLGGLRVIDLSNMANPIEVGFFDTPGTPTSVTVSGNYAYLPNGKSGLRIIDIADPTEPQDVGLLKTEGSASSVAVSGNFAYLTDGDLRIIDINNPLNPVEVGAFIFPYDIYPAGGVPTIIENYAYVPVGYGLNAGGLYIIDISNPFNPQEVGFLLGLPDQARACAVNGNYAYIANDAMGLRVIDISNPVDPHEVGSLELRIWAEDVAVQGNFVYVANGEYGLRVINVGNPSIPKEVGFYDYSIQATGLKLIDDYIFVASKEWGLVVLQNDLKGLAYEVTFKDWNGSTLKTDTVEFGSAAAPPAAPIREGYRFVGWDTDYKNVTNDLIVNAQYINSNSFIVTFNDWDGTTLKTEYVEKGGTATAPADPIREGYTFTGWDVNYSNIISDLSVTAQYYTSIMKHTLTLDDVDFDAATGTIIDYTSNYTNIIIPSSFNVNGTDVSVETIGKNAFYGSTRLESVIIPNSVTSIGFQAFYANNFTNVTIPNSVISIEGWAFYGSSIKSVTLSNSLISIGNSVFASNSITSVTLPNGLTFIGEAMFQDNKITSINFPQSITSIEALAFNLNNLTNIIIPRSIKNIDYAAFGYNSLKSVIFEANSSINLIGSLAFSVNPGLEGITLPTHANTSFSGYKDNEGNNYNAGDTFTDINNYNNACYAALPAHTLMLEDVDFDVATGTINDYRGGYVDIIIPSIINVNGTDVSVKSIGEDVFFRSNIVSVNIFDSVTSIGDNAFGDNYTLTSVIIPNNVIYIGGGAFYGNNLNSVTIPANVEYIGNNSFGENENLSSVIFEANSHIRLIDNDAFPYNSGMAGIILPTNVNSGFTGYLIRGNLYNAGDTVKNVSDLRLVIPMLLTLEDVIFEAASGTIIEYTADYTDIIIPSTFNVNGEDISVTSIGDGAFSANNTGIFLTTVVISDSVTYIADEAFSFNHSLINITLPNQLKYIGAKAFYWNDLSNVTLPDKLTYIGNEAFTLNYLSNVILPDKLTYIGDSAFYRNVLQSVTIPNSVTYLGEYSFALNRLRSITIENGVTTIGAYAFYSNYTTSFTIPNSVTYVGERAFVGNRGYSVTLPSPVIKEGYRFIEWLNGNGDVVTEMYTFSNTFYEAKFTPIIQVNQTLNFNIGWNIFSVPNQPGQAAFDTLFQPLISNKSLIKIQDESGNSFEDWGIFGSWQNNIGNISVTEGYKIKVNRNDTLEVSGSPVDYPYAIPLKTGWNITGYPQQTNFSGMNLVQQLIDRGTLVKVQDEAGNSIEDWGIFGGWKNNIYDFVPGKGYNIKLSADDTLWINESYTKSSAIQPEIIAATHFNPAFTGNGLEHMNINLVGLPVNILQAGDELAIFDGTTCVGAISLMPHHLQSQTASIAVSANDNQGMPGFAEGNPITLKLWNSIQNSEFILEPEIVKGTSTFAKHETTVASLEKYTATGLDDMFAFEQPEINCYPNPFSDEINIEIKLAKDSEVQVEVLNQMGQRMKFLQTEKLLYSGVHRLTWDGRNASNQSISQGIYHLKIIVDEKEIHKKIVYSK